MPAGPLVVIAYPSLSPRDLDWIQDFRSKHDRLYFDILKPHFTFVFPQSGVAEAEFAAHVREKSAAFPKIEFTLRCAAVWDNAMIPYWHVFLVPDEGFSAVVKLHDRLYEGVLAPELRLDIPFIPHIGIASSRDATACKALADQVNALGLSITGTIDALDVATLGNEGVKTIERVDLA